MPVRNFSRVNPLVDENATQAIYATPKANYDNSFEFGIVKITNCFDISPA
jgi:hypothetical protein